MDEKAVRDLLAAEIKKAGSMKKFADMHGLSMTSVSLMANGQRSISERMLELLGVCKVTEFEFIRK